MHQSTLSVFPDAPVGATMFSSYIAYHVLSGHSSITQTQRALFGKIVRSPIDNFGEHIHLIKRKLPQSLQFDAAGHIQWSTALGFYACALPEDQRRSWLQSQMVGEISPVNKFLYGPNRRFVKDHLHFCSECIRRDMQSHGMSFWRIAHQLPGVHHCPTHRALLNGACKTCGLAQASRAAWNMPSELCPHCGSSSFDVCDIFTSVAYLKYLTLCEAASQGNNVGADPLERLQLYRLVVEASGGLRSRHVEDLREIVLSQWSCESLEDLEKQLQAPFDVHFLGGALVGHDVIANPVAHLALIAALRSSRLDLPRTTNPTSREADKAPPFISRMEEVDCASALQYELALLISKPYRFTEIVTNAVLSGKSNNYLDDHFNLSWNRVEAFRKELQKHGIIEHFKNIQDAKVLEILTEGLPIGKQTIRAREREIDPRSHFRSKICIAILNGASSREDVKKTSSSLALRWCRKHDAEWLAEKLPLERAASIVDDKLTAYRHQILEYLANNKDLTVTRLEREIRGPYRWCVRNDLEWLESKVAPYRRRKRRVVTKKRRTKKAPALGNS
ncbi:MAG TPA: TniQ family protein [Burkholderiaceae bacterium]|nr:TniQ family protein [Burkholderiaceae bacterium]